MFAIKPENFWELLARRKRLEICVGVRRPPDTDSAESAWVVASDAVLVGEVLNGVSTLGGTAKALTTSQTPTQRAELPPHPEHLRQSLVWSPGTMTDEEVRGRATDIHESFCDSDGDKALVCLGSVKSNPVVELVLSSAFGGDPYKSQDNVKKASDRTCPFFLRYRDKDPHPPALSAGLQLSQTEKADQPGIYYEQADGSWAFAGGASRGHDAALVFYIYRESLGRLEMILSGFSGRATRLLARTLAHRAEDFWPRFSTRTINKSVHSSFSMKRQAKRTTRTIFCVPICLQIRPSFLSLLKRWHVVVIGYPIIEKLFRSLQFAVRKC